MSLCFFSLFSFLMEEGTPNFLYMFRFLTIDSSIFVFMVVILNIVFRKFQKLSGFLFFLRLSAAITETVIFCVVVFGFFPLAPDSPNISDDYMFLMHIIIPILTTIWFFMQEYTSRKICVRNGLRGTFFIFTYALFVIPLIISGVISHKYIPYSFLDIYSYPIWYICISLMIIYLCAFLLSLFFLKIFNKKQN